jgi:hypothetical protein
LEVFVEIAYRIYPLPNGTRYTEDDIQTIDDVVIIFDYCQILEANISKKGWKYLLDKFGMDGLFEADKRSGWFDCGSVEEFAEEIEYEMDKADDAIIG